MINKKDKIFSAAIGSISIVLIFSGIVLPIRPEAGEFIYTIGISINLVFWLHFLVYLVLPRMKK